MEAAATENNGGRFDTPFDEIAAVLEVKLEQVTAVVSALEERGMLQDGVIVNWGKRQFASDTSTNRVRKHRQQTVKRADETDETLQERSGNDGETFPEQDVTPSEQSRAEQKQRRADARADAREIASDSEQGGDPEQTDFFGPPPVPQDAHMRFLDNQDLVDVFCEIRPQWRGQKLTKWIGALAELLEENPQVSRETVAAWLREVKPDSGSNPGIWWDRRKSAWERDQAQAGPVSTGLPAEHWEDPFVRICDRPWEVQDVLGAWKGHCLPMAAGEENKVKDWLKQQLAAVAAGTLKAEEIPYPARQEAVA